MVSPETITLKLMLPGILAAFIYSITGSLETFEVPAIMGLPGYGIVAPGSPADLGASWIHTPVGNPLSDYARLAGVAHEFEDRYGLRSTAGRDDHTAAPRPGVREQITYERTRLASGDVVPGPAIIEEFGSTVPVHPGFVATVDAYGNLLLTREGS